MSKHKIWENRLRRIAERQGFKLHKVRRYDPRAIDYGTYYLSDVQNNFLVFPRSYGKNGVGAYLEEVEEFLNKPWEEKRQAQASKPESQVS